MATAHRTDEPVWPFLGWTLYFCQQPHCVGAHWSIHQFTRTVACSAPFTHEPQTMVQLALFPLVNAVKHSYPEPSYPPTWLPSG